MDNGNCTESQYRGETNCNQGRYHRKCRQLLYSWDKSLNIGSCMCCEFSSKFTASHLTVWNVRSKSEATPSIYWSLAKSPLFFLRHFWLSDFVSVIIREQKGLRKKGIILNISVMGPLYIYIYIYIYIYDMISWEHYDALHVSNNWLLITIQMVKC